MPVAIDASAGTFAASLSAAFPTPEGAALATATFTTAAGLAKQLLTKRQETRVDTVLKLAAERVRQHTDEVAAGGRRDSRDFQQLVEGTLLAAKDTYEEKKLPLLANLMATAPFTSTPVTNLVGTLRLAESLTYRQLCILPLIPGYDPDPRPRLSGRSIADIFAATQFDEGGRGILHDVLALMTQNLIGSVVNGVFVFGIPPGDATPASLRLTYPATLIVNAARACASIPDEDLGEIRKVLMG